MIYQPPFTLLGEAGKALGPAAASFAALGVIEAELRLRSLDVDELSFTIKQKAGRVIPDDNQWITLKDASGAVLFTGLTKRSFTYGSRTYSYVASNVYKGLMEMPLLSAGRAFVLYLEQNLTALVLNILNRAITAGLRLQAPLSPPIFYLVPKMAFRSQTIASTLEDALKWAPDCVSMMDYNTTPPTLRFNARLDSLEKTLNLGQPGHGVTDIRLTPFPEARALAVSMAYSRRSGPSGIEYLVQSAGNQAAEANRKISLFISGNERSDLLVSEALTTALNAVSKAEAAQALTLQAVAAMNAQLAADLANQVAATNAANNAVSQAAATAQIPLTWATIVARDSRAAAAVAAQASFTMDLTLVGQTYYTGIGCGIGGRPSTTISYTPTGGVNLKHQNASSAAGWYPIQAGAFTSAQLATAGATKITCLIDGWCNANTTGGSAGQNSITASAPASFRAALQGYTQNYTPNCSETSLYFQRWFWYYVSIPVDAIDISPQTVAARVVAANNAAANNTSSPVVPGPGSGGTVTFVPRAEFVEAPADLALNYFTRQDWTPYKGSISLAPSAALNPVPGDFISISGPDIPADWSTAKVPVAETTINLDTLAITVTIGPSPRMDFSSLVDRLRIPVEDNYEPG